MTRSDKILLVTFFVVFSAMLFSFYKLQKLRSSSSRYNDGSIVRLYRPVPGGGMIYCSGTVVSDTHILTAAHCLAPTPFDEFPPTLEVRRSDDLPTGIPAEIESFDSRTDLGVLFGDFRTFGAKTEISGAEEIQKSYKEHNLVICGYPLAGRFTCSPLSNSNNYDFKFSSLGFAYPGMSGGPVIDTDTGLVVGTVTAVDEDKVITSPFVEVWKDLRVAN